MRICVLLSLFPIMLTSCQDNCDGSPDCFAEHVASSKETLEGSSLKATLSDTTTKSWSEEHGTQFEYLGNDGKAYLVYPGNTHVLKGQWTIIETRGAADICFLYPSKSRNLITGELGGRWACQNGVAYLDRLDEVRENDLLYLTHLDKLPKTLPRKIDVSIQAAMKNVGYSSRLTRNKVCRWDSRACVP